MSLIIRPAKQSDINGMLRLLQQLFAIEKDFHFDVTKQQKGLELLLEATNGVLMVADEKQAVIGMGSGQLVISSAEGGSSLFVEDVVVQPSWQSQGIGTRLLRNLGHWGAERGARRMQLLADRNNAVALDFYHRRGWQQTQLICLRKFHSATE
ncbi:MAG: N-acetyltransferase family protein [Desulfopila sp.]